MNKIRTPRPLQSTFDYSTLPEETAGKLREMAEVFEVKPQTAADVIAAGRVLSLAKELIGHGRFRAWVALESEWRPNMLQRCLLAAKKFDSLKKVQIALFDRSAIFLLSGRRLPDAARQTAIQEVGAGRRISHARAKEIAGIYVRKLAAKRAPSREEAQAAPPEKTLVDQVLQRFESVSLHVVNDENGLNLVQATAVDRSTGKFAVASRESSELVLMALADAEPKKRCGGCKKEKGVGEFSSNSSKTDGRCDFCRVCERLRIAEQTRKKRRLKQARA
jgi:hypothetical protein